MSSEDPRGAARVLQGHHAASAQNGVTLVDGALRECGLVGQRRRQLLELAGKRVTRNAIVNWRMGRRRTPAWMWSAIAGMLQHQVDKKLHWLAIAREKEKAPD